MSDEKVLTKEIAEQFMADEESVDLSEFTAIDDDAADLLSDAGFLDLCNVRTLSRIALKLLASGRQRFLSIGLSTITADTMEILFTFRGETLHLPGLQTIPEDEDFLNVFRYWGESSEYSRYCLMLGLTTMSKVVAESLPPCLSLGLSELTHLSDDVVDVLQHRYGHVYLESLVDLSDRAAHTLARKIQQEGWDVPELREKYPVIDAACKAYTPKDED
jgi:hypothetical protein